MAGTTNRAAAFMGMGAFNILWIGLLVTVVAVTLNRRKSRLGYWLNLGIVGATDLGLLVALLLPGTMAWSDGGLGSACTSRHSSPRPWVGRKRPTPHPRRPETGAAGATRGGPVPPAPGGPAVRSGTAWR